MKYVFFVVLSLASCLAVGASFPDLIKKEYKLEDHSSGFEGDQKSYVSFTKGYFKEINIRINALEKGHPLFVDKENYESPDILLGTIDMSGKGDVYYMVLSWGASLDISYMFYSVKRLKDYKLGAEVAKPDFSVEATSIIIPANGNIYAYGHNNNLHSIQKKYVFKDGNLRELSQPFHYVGRSAISLKEQTVFSDTGLTTELYKIAKGSPVTIVGLQPGSSNPSFDELYVVASEFGLVGYVKAEYEQKETQFSGFFYAGD